MSFMNFDLLGDLVDEQLNVSNESAQEPLVAGLRQVDVTISEIDLDWVPTRLREMFTFRSDIALNPSKSYQAKSVSIAVFAIRLDAEGNITHASPSIKNAHTSKNSEYLQGGNWDTGCTIMPDLYVESEFWGDDNTVIPVPTLLKEPYPAKSGNVNLSLSCVNKSVNNWQDYHNAQRQVFTELVRNLADEMGVPAGEQFLVCLFGFPQYSKAFVNEKNNFWRAVFSGGYMLGGRKVGTSSGLPSSLSGLRVKSNLMIGGKSMSARIAEEMMKAKSRKPQTPAPSAPRREMPPVNASKPSVTSNAPTPLAAQPQEEVKDVMPSAGIFDKLNNLAAQISEDEDEFELVELPAEEIELAQQETDSREDDDEPVIAVSTSRRANPFA